MKKQLLVIIIVFVLFMVWTACVAAELTLGEFIKQLSQAIEKQDEEKAKRLILQNPKVTQQVLQALPDELIKQLLEADKEKDEGKAKQLIEQNSQTTQIFQALQEEDKLKMNKMNHMKEEGEKAYYEARYQEALEKWNQGLEIAKKSENKQAIGAFLGNIGMVYDALGQYKKALAYYKQGLVIHENVGDKQGEGAGLTNIGNVLWHMGSYKEALVYYKQALTIDREIRDRKGEGADLANIGNVYQDLGQSEKALSYYEQALAIHREIGNRRDEGATIANIGIVYRTIGHYGKAQDYYIRSLVIHKETGDKQRQSTTLTNIGNLFWDMGQYEKALNYHKQALVISQEIGNRRGQGSILTNIGAAYHNLSQYDKALFYCEQALVIHEDIGDRGSQGGDLANIGLLHSSLGRYKKGLSYLERSLEIHKKIGNRREMGNSLNNIGEVYYKIGQYSKAHLFCYNSMKIFLECNAPDVLWMAQSQLGKAEAKLKKHNYAVKYYEQALNSIESVRTHISDSEFKISFMRDRVYVYDEFIEFLKNFHKRDPNKGYDKKAFEILERKQGRVFLEQMGKSGARNYAGFPDEVRNKETELDNQIAIFQSDLENERSKPLKDRNTNRISSLEQYLKKAKTDQEAFEKEIQTRYPDYYAIKYPKPVRLSELQNNVLKPGETMLIYGVMKKTACLWLVSKDQFAFFPIDITEKAFSEKVNLFRKGSDALTKAIKTKLPDFRFSKIYKKSLKEMHRSSHELYDLLIPKKARSFIPKEKTLYIIPTSSLYGLPFEALITKTDEKGVRYLIEDHPIAYLSSASLLKIIRDSQARKIEKARSQLLAFANPVYGTKENPCFTTTRDTSTDASSFSEMRTRGYLNLMGELCELPETEDEVKEIRNILKTSDDSLQLREKASKSNLFSLNKADKLNDYRYVIFSCHGLLPGEINQLNQPALALSHPDPADKNMDGFLTMAEAFSLKLNADLVTLSACNTGRGDEIRGEGVMGLTRAFMYAGTPAVSVTLWSVESQSAKTLSIGLFRNLKHGKKRAKALQEIKLRMIRGQEPVPKNKRQLYKHPYFWAPVVIFGDGN